MWLRFLVGILFGVFAESLRMPQSAFKYRRVDEAANLEDDELFQRDGAGSDSLAKDSKYFMDFLHNNFCRRTGENLLQNRTTIRSSVSPLCRKRAKQTSTSLSKF